MWRAEDGKLSIRQGAQPPEDGRIDQNNDVAAECISDRDCRIFDNQNCCKQVIPNPEKSSFLRCLWMPNYCICSPTANLG